MEERKEMLALMSARRRNLERDRKAIAYHYDVSNDFYELFLGRTMVYTCAYYRSPDGELDQAQEDKLDLVCRKLRLERGERLLDVGCGWGSLVRFAAKHYGVDAHGVTLSAAQASYAVERIREDGLESACRVECRDYRDLVPEEPYDKIAAVGIVEHVGVQNYSAYFARMRDLVKPGGLFLNHGITHERHWKWTPQWDFIVRYVFPNGELDNVSHLLTVAEEENWEIRDVEQLREHYSRTCRQWTERLLANRERALRIVPEKTFRIWVLYLAASAHHFAEGSIGLYQAVLEKTDRRARTVPTTREAIYNRSAPSRSGLRRLSA
jgi:cyclopropane-fatty-acyl-phospholipid synthase